MKPNLDAAPARWLSRYDHRERREEPFPRVGFAFQPRHFNGSFGDNWPPRRRPGFSNLANEVLRADASRSFRLESAVLGFVTLVCAWPIAVMIHEVIQLLK